MKNTDDIKKLLPKDTTLLGEWFGRLFIFDAGKEEFWWLPKIQKITNTRMWRIGWMYWALVVRKMNHRGELNEL